MISRQVALGGHVRFKDRFPSAFIPWPERWEVGQAEDGSFDPNLVPGYAESQAASEETPPAEEAPPAEGTPAEEQRTDQS